MFMDENWLDGDFVSENEDEADEEDGVSESVGEHDDEIDEDSIFFFEIKIFKICFFLSKLIKGL